MLVSTSDASKHTGLSQHELWRGYKQGRYPAIEIDDGEECMRLRWKLDKLDACLNEIMRKSLKAVNNDEESWR